MVWTVVIMLVGFAIRAFLNDASAPPAGSPADTAAPCSARPAISV
ncbi:hypothetical protein ABIE67_001173 [Streptomyces sp. V4I8]